MKSKQPPYENMKFIGIKKLGIVCPGPGRPYAAIALRSDNILFVPFCEPIKRIDTLADKIIELAVAHKIPGTYRTITIDGADEGPELCEKLKPLLGKNLLVTRDQETCFSTFPWEMQYEPPYRFFNRRAESFWNLMQWLKAPGKVVSGLENIDRIWREHRVGGRMAAPERE